MCISLMKNKNRQKTKSLKYFTYKFLNLEWDETFCWVHFDSLIINWGICFNEKKVKNFWTTYNWAFFIFSLIRMNNLHIFRRECKEKLFLCNFRECSISIPTHRQFCREFTYRILQFLSSHTYSSEFPFFKLSNVIQQVFPALLSWDRHERVQKSEKCSNDR